MSARLVGAGAFVAGALLGAGGLWLGLPPAPPSAAPPRDERPRPASPCTPGPAVDIAEIRAVVRQEVLAAAAAIPACAAAPVSLPSVMAAAAPPAPPEGRLEEAHPESSPPKSSGHESADAQRLVEGSLSRRVWSAEDRAQLQSLLPRLSPTERERVMRQVIVAVNRGELKAEVIGPLF